MNKSKNDSKSKVSKTKHSKGQHAGSITEKYSTGYVPNRNFLKHNVLKKLESKTSLSQKNKLFYYKDN